MNLISATTITGDAWGGWGEIRYDGDTSSIYSYDNYDDFPWSGIDGGSNHIYIAYMCAYIGNIPDSANITAMSFHSGAYRRNNIDDTPMTSQLKIFDEDSYDWKPDSDSEALTLYNAIQGAGTDSSDQVDYSSSFDTRQLLVYPFDASDIAEVSSRLDDTTICFGFDYIEGCSGSEDCQFGFDFTSTYSYLSTTYEIPAEPQTEIPPIMVAPNDSSLLEEGNYSFNCYINNTPNNANFISLRLYINGVEVYENDTEGEYLSINESIYLNESGSWTCTGTNESAVDINAGANWSYIVDYAINFDFGTSTNAYLYYGDGEQTNFTPVTEIDVAISGYDEGEAVLLWNDKTQIFQFDINHSATIRYDIENIDVDLVKEFIITDNGARLKDAWILIESWNGTSKGVVGAYYTDLNGRVYALVEENLMYRITVSKDGYSDYEKFIYIKDDGEPIVIELSKLLGTSGDVIITPTCSELVSEAQYCRVSVRSFGEVHIEYDYIWNGSTYNEEDDGYSSYISLLINNETTPVYLNISIDGTLERELMFNWTDGNYTILLDIDYDNIASDSKLLVLIYFVIIFLGFVWWILVNQLWKGMGIYIFGAWGFFFALNGFGLFYFPFGMISIYGIFTAIWGGE